MATAQEYADWIVKNEAKKGTPEFETVAAAYRQLRGDTAAAVPQPGASAVKGSVAGGAFMGLRDPIDAGAQLLVRALPDSVVRAGNRLNNVLADAGVPGISRLNVGTDGGTVSGLVTGAKADSAAPVDRMIRDANAEYDASRSLAGRDGIDLARIAGNIANPINRVVPLGGATSSAGVALRAGIQGAISGAAQPVVDGGKDFASTKAGQIGIGAVTSAAGGYTLDKLVQGVGKLWAGIRAKPAIANILGGQADLPPQVQANLLLQQAAQAQGMDLAQIPSSIMDRVRGEVEKAVRSGKNIDARALMRSAEGNAVLGDDAGLLLGQATRDPLQFAEELNLRGVQNAGRPIAERLNLQNTRLIESVGKKGAAGAPDAYEAGAAAIKSLQATDKRLSQGVTDAYTAFRKAGGSTVDVPLQPVAQRLGEVLDTYGRENLPGAVARKLEEYGLFGTKQTKVFDLLEADKLIKVINANFDPLKKSEAGALGALRKGLNEAIDLADTQSQGASGPAADLLRSALKTAKDRFALHEAVPALENAATNPKAQERFVRDFITSKTAGIDSVERLIGLLQGDALEGVKRNVLADILEKAAPGAARGSDVAAFSQAGYSRALDSIGDRKLLALFGQEGVDQLRQVQRVAEWIQKQPKGSAVNNSNSAGALMNLLQGMAGKSDSSLVNKLSGLPGVNIVRNSLAQSLDDRTAARAVQATIRPTPAELSAEEIAALRRNLPAVSGALGVAASSGVR